MRRAKELAIFEYVLVLQINPDTSMPFIAYRYPPSTENGKDSISGPIMRFCFPELEISGLQQSTKDNKKKLMGNTQSQTFSFVLTDSDGSRKFGYCRRLRVPNPQRPSDSILECHCILSLCTSFSLFRQVLDIVEERRRASTKPKPTAVFSFLQSVLANKFPDPGETISIRTFAVGNGGSSDGATYKLNRSLGSRFEYLDHVSFCTLFKLMPIPNILELFSNMVLERRAIVAAKTLSVLSSCVNALSALLYPFSWQHVFIPVLPQSLLDYCSAPMPFLLGILADSIPAVKKQPLEEVYIVDLDKGKFIVNPGFPNVLPPHELRTLEMSLEAITASGKKGRAFDLGVAAAFLDFFQSCLSEYPKFILPALTVAFRRETMSERGTLKNCVLLQVQTVAEAHEQLEQPMLAVCFDCGGDVEGDDTQDKDDNPICLECLEAKARKKSQKVGGWLKNLRVSDENTVQKLKVNVSKRFGKNKDKLQPDEAPQIPPDNLVNGNTTSAPSGMNAVAPPSPSPAPLPKTGSTPSLRSTGGPSSRPQVDSGIVSQRNENRVPQKKAGPSASLPPVSVSVSVNSPSMQSRWISGSLGSNHPGSTSTDRTRILSKPKIPTVSQQSGNTPPTGSARFCAGCGKRFGNGELVLAAFNTAWHKGCLTCNFCQKPFLELKFIEKDNKPFHPACHQQLFNQKCSLCSETLNGQCVKIDDKVAHARCFACDVCKAPLKNGYVMVGSRACCPQCGGRK